MKVTIITGISGAGKSSALKTLEDIDFLCADNIPPALIPQFVRICMASPNPPKNIALAADMRMGAMFESIYDAIEEMEQAMKGMLEPKFKEVVLGHAEVRQVFKITGAGAVAGCYVQDGKIQRNAEVRVVRDGIVFHEGHLNTLKRFKDDVKEVATSYECGMSIENYNDIKEGDIIECFVMEEVKQ